MIEFAWFAINVITLVTVVAALADALHDLRAVRRYNGRAKEINAGTNVRREVLRLGVAFGFLGALLPVGREFRIACLIAGAAAVAANSVLDWRDRKRLAREIDREAAGERRVGMPELAADVADTKAKVTEIRERIER